MPGGKEFAIRGSVSKRTAAKGVMPARRRRIWRPRGMRGGRLPSPVQRIIPAGAGDRLQHGVDVRQSASLVNANSAR
jgi:hypothetical protein